MQIPPSIIANLPPLTLAGTATGLPLKPGQILDATVSRAEGSGLFTLAVAGKEIGVKSALPLANGQQLRLAVVASSDGLVLKLLASPGERPTPSPSPLSRQLLRILPQQRPLKPLLETLANLKFEPATLRQLPSTQQLPLQRLFDTVQQLARQMATPEQLTRPEQLKQAIAESGHFFEPRLASALGGAPFPDKDLKGLLLRLIAQLIRTTAGSSATTTRPATPAAPPLPPEIAHASRQQPLPPYATGGRSASREGGLLETLLSLLKQAEGGLAKIQTQQLITAAQRDSDSPVWLLELPLRDGKQFDTLQLRIRQQRGKGEAAESSWSVTLTLADSAGAPLQVHLLLSKTHHLSCHFSAQRSETVNAFRHQLPALQKRLEQSGFEIGQIGCHHQPHLDPTDEAAIERELNNLIHVTA